MSTVSHHLLRRRARAHAHRLNQQPGHARYTVQPAQRGPWRWHVIQLERPHDE